MPILQFSAIVIAVGVLLWCANQYVPMDAKIKKLLNVVVIIVLVLWVLDLFGVFGPLAHLHVGR